MGKTQILTNLKETDCCEMIPNDKLIHFSTDRKSGQFENSVFGHLGKIYTVSLYPLSKITEVAYKNLIWV